MRSLYAALLFFFAHTGVHSQISLRESGPGVLQPSQTLRVVCKVSGASLTDISNMHGVHWIRQPPGKGLEWVGVIYYNNDMYRSQSLQSRLTISRDTAKQEVYLELRSVETGDGGTYYCARDGNLADWGKGTQVTVTEEPVTAPTVFPLIPCCVDRGSTSPLTLGCLMSGYLPEPVNVTWTSGSTISSVRTPSSAYNAASGLHMRSSQITVPAGSWITGKYTCSVEQEYTGLKQEKTVAVTPCTPPSVKAVLSSSCDAPQLRRNRSAPKNSRISAVDLICLISDYYPSHLQVQWLANGKPSSLSASVSSPSKGENGLFSATSRLSVLQGEWNQGTLYSCDVTHTATNASIMANISKCAEPCSLSIAVSLLPPPFEELYLTHSGHLTCLATNIKTTQSFEIVWTRDTAGPLNVVTDDPQLNDNGTYSVTSRLAVCAEEWISGEKFTCTVKHQDLPSPVKVDIMKRKDGSARAPQVYLLPPSPEELALQEMVTLFCYIKGFNPPDTLVKWLAKGKEVDSGSYATTSPLPSLTGGSYYRYSSLQVPAAEWTKGNAFTCVVGHEALPMNLAQKSIDKSSDSANPLHEVDACYDVECDYKTTTATFMVLFLLSLFYSATVTLFKVKKK